LALGGCDPSEPEVSSEPAADENPSLHPPEDEGSGWACADRQPTEIIDLAIDGRTVAIDELLQSCVRRIVEVREAGIALQRAAYVGKDRGEVVRLLLDAGVPATFRDASGNPALVWAARAPSVFLPADDAYASDKAAVVSMLLAAGGDPNVSGEFGGSPLHAAASAGLLAIVDLLVAAAADVDAVDDVGLTPLMVAAGVGETDVVVALLKAGADVAHHDHLGRSAIDLASNQGHDETVGVLRSAAATDA
jgi:hypothetical protein